MDNNSQTNTCVLFTKRLANAESAAALAVIGIAVSVYLRKFYTIVVCINVALLGYMLFRVRIFDAVFESVNHLPLTITFAKSEIYKKQLQQDVIFGQNLVNR